MNEGDEFSFSKTTVLGMVEEIESGEGMRHEDDGWSTGHKVFQCEIARAMNVERVEYSGGLRGCKITWTRKGVGVAHRCCRCALGDRGGLGGCLVCEGKREERVRNEGSIVRLKVSVNGEAVDSHTRRDERVGETQQNSFVSVQLEGDGGKGGKAGGK